MERPVFYMIPSQKGSLFNQGKRFLHRAGDAIGNRKSDIKRALRVFLESFEGFL